jgi:hypothetical protein
VDLTKLTPAEILTAALVVVTIYYAWQTRQTVKELRNARGASIFPRIRATVFSPGAGNGFVHITNVGTGPALDIRATVTFQPGGPPTPWRSQLLLPGETSELQMRSTKDPDGTFRIEDVIADHPHLHLDARYLDALGEEHHVDERLDIREWWTTVVAAGQSVGHDWPKETRDELEKIRKELEKVTRSISKIADRDDPRPCKWEMRVRRLPPRVQAPARRVAKSLGLVRR